MTIKPKEILKDILLTKNQRYGIYILMLIIILVCIFLINTFVSTRLGKNWYLDNRPECYMITGSKCMDNYDLVNLQGSYWSLIPMKQCCLRPHYLLQTNEPTLFTLKEFCENVINTSYASDEKGEKE